MQVRRRIAVETARPGLLFGLVALVTLLLDQASKYLVRADLAPGESMDIIAGVLAITHVRNIGGAFGLLAGYRVLFIAVMVLVLLGVAIYWYRARPRYVWLCIALGLVAAGAVGNAIDRLNSGLVTDFIDVFSRYWPVFNVADAAIVVGVGMLLIWVALAPEEQSESDAGTDDSELAEGPADSSESVQGIDDDSALRARNEAEHG